MGKYDKYAEVKIDKIIKESARSANLLDPHHRLGRPKAIVVSRRAGNHQMMAGLQGE